MPTSDSNKISAINYLHYILFGGAILYFGRILFIPLSFALLISFILYPVCVWFEKKGVSKVAAIGICISALVIFFILMIAILIQQFLNFMDEWGQIRNKLYTSFYEFGNYLNNNFNITPKQFSDWFNKILDTNIIPLVQSAIFSSGSSIVLFLLIPIYAALILYYRSLLAQVLYSYFSEEKRNSIHEILIQSIHTYYNFIKGMLLVYIIVGILNSIGLLILGIPHAILFGFLAAIMTIIPYVGIIIASLLPITISWITFNSAWYPIGVIAIFTIVQYLEANIIFPWAVSSKLKINTLVTLIVIIAGGIIWGAAGMILFIPFIAIFKLIADKTESIKPLGRLIGN